jgi:hypothetical protein
MTRKSRLAWHAVTVNRRVRAFISLVNMVLLWEFAWVSV